MKHSTKLAHATAYSALLAFLSLLPLVASAAEAKMDFNRDIRPILSENCFACHGFDEKAREAELRLDRAESAYADRDGSIAVKPGDLAASALWERVSSTDVDLVMPPPQANLHLTAAQKDKLKLWIEQGAPYAGHWSFIPPTRPDVPSIDGKAPANPIDGFVLARLAEEKLRPAKEADRRTLIRRLSLDLTGLPPSAEEVEAFVNDSDPKAYENLVARLLHSPHFGERLALDWLDAARYADTNGFSIDGGRQMWLWRDWVIQAYNDSKPYDRFLIEQLAGDLLPNPTEADLIATGFQRNNMVTHEGGTIPEENLTNYNADRVKTLGEAVLGLTLACAQCHDHKFDPITQKDYYQTFAFFNSLGDKALDGNGGINPGPVLMARTVLKTGEEPQLHKQIAALQARMATVDEKLLSSWMKREQQILTARGQQFKLHPLKLLKVSTPNRGAGFDVEGENRVRIRQPGGLAAFDVSAELPPLAEPVTAIRVVVHPLAELPGGGWGSGPSQPRRGKAMSKAGEVPAKGNFVLTALSLTADKLPSDQVNLHRLEDFSRVTASSWQEEFPPAACLDPRNESGWSPDLAAEGPVHLTATLAGPLDTKATPFLTTQLNFGFGGNLVPGLVELFAVTGTDDGTDLPVDVVAALEIPAAERTAEMHALLWQHCSAHAEELQATRTDLANLKEWLAALTEPQPTMVMNVADKPRETFILNRGDYAQPTTKVTPGTLASLPPLPAGVPDNRLGLAQWLTMPSHPLTARVAVNRFWKLFFGTGLVATPADFGSQGEWPSHPELLDWLAVDFVESGWDVKRLVTLIVTSQTYRQTSATPPQLLERDPQNRLLARGPRFRLPAELVRDNALKVSGLLVPRIGGPSVNPYTPGDLWREISHYGSTPATAQAFVQDHGDKLYRRSLYTFWKRTAPPPNMAAFDAPNREVCTVSRANTTTPLQALVGLNDPQFVEAARAFAERVLSRDGNDAARLQWAIVECLSRPPSEQEREILASALHRERQRYAKDEAAARKLLAIGESPRDARLPLAEHAAWTQVGALLLNLSETVTRN